MKKISLTSFRIWNILYPLLMYWAVIVVVMFLTQMTFGTDTKHYMLCEIISTLVALPVVYFSFYRPDHRVKKIEQSEKRVEVSVWNIIGILMITALISIALNNLLCMSPLAKISTGFSEANSRFYGSTVALQILGSAFLTPILEEFIYRGVIFERLRDTMEFIPAMVISSLIFAVMHFNWVQFIFAFLIGMLLALYVEKTGHVYGAIIAHILSNFIAVMRTNFGILGSTVDGSLSAWLLSVGLLLGGVAILQLYTRKIKSRIS